jgi:hypothetical protein
MVVHKLECFYLLENFRPDATGGKKNKTKQNKASRHAGPAQ